LLGHKSIDLIAVPLVSIVLMGFLLQDGEASLVRTIATLLYLFVLPGYVFVAATFPGKNLGGAERLLYVIGSGLCIIILGILLINISPWPITKVAWIWFVALVIWICSGLAIVRRHRAQAYIERRLVQQGVRLQFIWPQILMLGIAVLITIGAIWLARHYAQQPHTSGFTQLWILPVDQSSRDVVRVGFANYERRTEVYTVRAIYDGTIIREWSDIALDYEQTWEERIELEPSTQANMLVIELYLQPNTSRPYRQVFWWQNLPTPTPEPSPTP
jgi:Predicted membrane protein